MQATLKNRTIFCKDNLEVLRGIDNESVDLIYLDPPFNKKKVFTAPIGSTAAGASFQDIFNEADVKEEWLGLIAEAHPAMKDYIVGIGKIGHKSNKNYLCYMAIRLIEMHRILKPTGSIYLHCDPTMSHYLKILLDCIFGEKKFRNEIVWCYKEQESATRYFPRKHDIIFFYSKNEDYTFHIPWQPHSEAQLKRYNIVREDGRYANMKGKLRKLGEGSKLRDYWIIDIVQSREKTGYPTQKPLGLLEIVVRASSNEGDFVLDPFCGCATTCIAAEKLKRNWVGIDISKKAFTLVKDRLGKQINEKDTIFQKDKVIYREDIPERTDRAEKKHDRVTSKHSLYGKQEGFCLGCEVHFNFSNLTIDHIVPKGKGGGEGIKNLQLLCNNCNSVKGEDDMAVLKTRLKEKGIL